MNNFSVKKTVKRVSIFILLFIFISCNKNKFNAEFVGSFPPPVELTGERIFKSEYGLRNLIKIDSLMIITTTRDTLIHIYDVEQNFIKSMGTKGRGPTEFNAPPLFLQSLKKDSTTYIFILNHNLLTFSRINLTATLDSNKIVIDKRYNLPGELVGTSQIFFINNTLLAGMYDDHFSKQLDEKRGLFFYHPDTKKFITVPLYNYKVEPYKTISVAIPASNANARGAAIKPDRTKIALISLMYPMLEILDINSSNVKRYLLKEKLPELPFKVRAIRKRKIINYYNNLTVSNNHIYLLYFGGTLSEYVTPHPTRIQVLDWKGHPQAQYLIPAEYTIVKFIVDEKNKVFYGLSYVKDAIYKFEYGKTQ